MKDIASQVDPLPYHRIFQISCRDRRPRRFAKKNGGSKPPPYRRNFRLSCRDRRPRRSAKTKILIITPNRDCISNFIANGRRNASPTIKFKVLSYGSFSLPPNFHQRQRYGSIPQLPQIITRTSPVGASRPKNSADDSAEFFYQLV